MVSPTADSAVPADKLDNFTDNASIDDTFQQPIPLIKDRDASRIVTFSPLQEWEGYVIDIGSDTFVANLIDKTAKKTMAEESMEFPIADLSEDDRDMLRVGAIFRWSVGYQKRHGSKRKVSEIVFRRLPALTRSDFDAANNRVESILEAINWA